MNEAMKLDHRIVKETDMLEESFQSPLIHEENGRFLRNRIVPVLRRMNRILLKVKEEVRSRSWGIEFGESIFRDKTRCID